MEKLYLVFLCLLLTCCYQSRAIKGNREGRYEFKKVNKRKRIIKIRYFDYNKDMLLLKKGKKTIDTKGTWQELIEQYYIEYDSISGSKKKSYRQKKNGKLVIKEWGYKKYPKYKR